MVPEGDRLLNDEQVAALFGVAPSTLSVWRSRRKGPPFVKIGERVTRYRASDIEAWIAAHTVGGAK